MYVCTYVQLVTHSQCMQSSTVCVCTHPTPAPIVTESQFRYYQHDWTTIKLISIYIYLTTVMCKQLLYLCACVSWCRVGCVSHNGVILLKRLVVTRHGKYWRKIIKVIDVDSYKDVGGYSWVTIVLQQQGTGRSMYHGQQVSLSYFCLCKMHTMYILTMANIGN